MGKKIALLVLLVLILGGALLQNNYVNNATKSLVNNIENIKSALDKEDYESAISAAEEFSSSWKEDKKIFEALFEHKEIDIISATAKSIQSLCESEEKVHALSEIASITYYFNHIREIDCVGWENIL